MCITSSVLQLDSDDGILHVRQHVFIELIFISVLVFFQYNMYIKKVIIEGFRTYRNKTVLCLEPGLNVIIGRNGSGKTNMLCAIQFVLAYDYHQLPPRERQNMLHLSAGFRATSASVEIVFNNEDRRLPEEGNEVSLKREITSSKDVFYLNGKSITKEQVLNTLESAGLSKVNPYYIIRQGRINDLATATDKKRLEQFTDIAGSLTWKEIQPKNVSLLKDAEKSIERLTEFIEIAEVDLEALQKDEQVYQSWSETNTQKRALEFLLGMKEKERLSSRITDLEKSLVAAKYDESVMVSKCMTSNQKVTEADLLCKSYQDDFRVAEEKLRSLKAVGEDLVTEHSKLELELGDRKSSTNENLEKLNGDLSQIEKEISLKRNELSIICDDYNSAVQEEYEINTRLILSDQRRKQLFAKLGRGTLFTTVEERNQWINEELSKIYSLVVQGEEKLHCIFEDIKQEESKAKALEEVIKRLETEKVTSVESLKFLNQVEKQRLLLDQRRLQMSRNELRRKENEVREQWIEARAKLEELKSNSSARRFLSSNLRRVEFILDKMRREGPGTNAFEMASQYRGIVIEQFDYEGAEIIVDAVGGDKLFHNVVDTSAAANEILRWINREPYDDGIGLPGTFCFYALDRLQIYPPIRGHNANDHFPLVGNLKAVEGMQKLVDHIFGRILICRTFDIATETAKRLKINCVFSSGVIDGGFRNPAHSRSNVYFETRNIMNEEKTKLASLQEVENEIKEIDCNHIEITNQLQRLENKIRQNKLDFLEEDLRKQKSAYSVSKQAIEGKNAFVRNVKMSLESNRAQIKMLQEELQQEFVCELGEAERAEMEILHQDIDSAKKVFQNTNVGRLELEGKKNLLESRLNDHLMRKKQDLERAIHEKSVCGLTTQTETNQQAIRVIEEHLRKLESLMNKNKDEIGVAENKIAELSNYVIEAKNEFDKLNTVIEKQKAILEKYNVVTKRIEESIRRNKVATEAIESTILSLGTFDEQNEKNIIAQYSDYNVKRLGKELDSVTNRLKGFKNVNQKAAMEYAMTRENLENLSNQMNRMKRSHDNCRDLNENVEKTKNDSVVYSFMQVARSFRNMFRTLIPDLDEITGIAVKVSFTGTSSVQNLNSLSGGQRSVVSLALVFAILMMNRAPFYLLDEADMALDVNYRTKVAAMVDKFSKQSQFIAITFRPELLEHADNIIGVSFDAATQTSRAASITKEVANDFVSSHGSASSGGSSNSRSTCNSDRIVRLP
uniref:Structural maintenance of chromosomes protein n=1 Tax=Daphnia galeata TaxID=27404 RepID=A0A8J2S6L6_9CRUS|nr:unnamed protein product [Daphnia galeata]